MATVGENIKAARIAAGLTQEELAKKVNTTKSAISRYEQGKREPSLATLTKIAVSLETRFEDIVGLETFETGAEFDREWKRRASNLSGDGVVVVHKSGGEVQIIDHRKERLNQNYDNLDEESQKQLVKYSDFLVNALEGQ